MNESTKCTETWKYLRLPHIPNKGNEHRAAVKHSLRKCSLHINTGCPRRNVPDFGRVFLMLKYTDITQNTYVQS